MLDYAPLTMRSISIFIIFIVGIFSSTGLLAAEREQALCPHFALRGKESIDLSDTEKRLICGDPENKSWDRIPPSQAFFNLKTFLQDRGYYDPRLTTEKDKSVVDLGTQTHVSQFEFIGGPPELLPNTYRRVTGELLTPGFLDSLTKRVYSQLRSVGFPCPKVECEADRKSGKVLVNIKTGPRQNVVSIREEAIAGINERMLRRYDAFEIGMPYNESWLALTADRTMRDGVVQSTHFTAECQSDGAALTQNFVAGPSRNVTIGLGVDTEELVKLRGTWKNQRVGNTASTLEVGSSLSFRLQQIGAVGNWYYLNHPSRHYLRPSVKLGREYTWLDNPPKERYFGQAQFAPAITWDNQWAGLTLYGGPTLLWEYKTKPNSVKTQSLSLSADAILQTHDFELNRSRPRGGSYLSFHGDFANREWLSTVTVRTLKVNFEQLWNIKHYDPPWNVLGIRGGVGLTFTESDYLPDVPEIYRQYLGGSQDLRGFGVREIAGRDVADRNSGDNLGGQGGLTSVFLGIEDRFPDLLPWGLQPFVFVDAGMFGTSSLSLEPLLYWNPGFGLRLDSPIGVFRATLAHGYLAGNKSYLSPGKEEKLSHPNFYFSYGQEF